MGSGRGKTRRSLSAGTATVTTDSVQSIVEEFAAEPGAPRFRASQIVQRTGADVGDVYEQLEALAAHGDLERHFELCHPITGRPLEEFRLGDKVPVGDTYESEDGREEPFIVTADDIFISFSPTLTLRKRAYRG